MKNTMTLLIAIIFLSIPLDSFTFDSKLPSKTVDKNLNTVDSLLMGYETGDKKFDEYLIGDKIVFHHQRKVENAIVENDFVVYQFDSKTNVLVNEIRHWRDDIPEKLPDNLLSQFEAELMITGYIQFSELMYISPESNVFPLDPTPKNPCWVIWFKNNDSLEIYVIDAVDGKYLGRGIAPPSSGNTAFSTSGPQNFQSCNGGWWDWRNNATYWFNQMGYNTNDVSWASNSTIENQLQSNEMALFYQIAHGSSFYIQPGCSDGDNPSELTPYNIYKFYRSEYEEYPKIPFTFIASCGGMCSDASNSFSYSFRKGSNERTTVVGYCGMDTSECSSCWSQSVLWQGRLFSYINGGDTVKVAFDKTNADYPSCAANQCMRFAGDEFLTLFPPVTRCEKNTPSCSGDKILLSKKAVSWDDYSIENNPCDEGCCDSNKYCVLNGQCYFGGSNDWDYTVHNIEFKTNKALICNTMDEGENAAWINLDYSQSFCEQDSSNKWRMGKGDANIESNYNPEGNGSNQSFCKWNLENPIGSDNPSTECCCGDDIEEFPMVSPFDGSEACCNTANECVINGVCQNHPITTEVCGDLIDNDCDGLLDCQDPDCDNMPFVQSYYNENTYSVIVENLQEYTLLKQYNTGELIHPNVEFEFSGFDSSDIKVQIDNNGAWKTIYSSYVANVPIENGWHKVISGTDYYTTDKVRILVKEYYLSGTEWFVKNFKGVAKEASSCGEDSCNNIMVCDYVPGQNRTKCGSSGNPVGPCTFCNDFGEPTVTPEICSDGQDNDCDGLVDCQDPDCFNEIPESCGDGIDNDCDGLVDCMDPSCDGYNFGGSCGSHPQCEGQWVCDANLTTTNSVCSTHGINIDPDPKDNDPSIDECWTCNLYGNPAYVCGGIN